MMRDLTPLVEPLSIDEAFLDLGGTSGCTRRRRRKCWRAFQCAWSESLELTVSVGLSYCKFLAKVASDLQKPRGFSVIGKGEALAFLRRQPVSVIWGVGKATQQWLARDGIPASPRSRTWMKADLARRYGSIGLRLARLSRGVDVRKVEPNNAIKSISSETTFNDDISGRDALAPVLRELSEKVSARLKRPASGRPDRGAEDEDR